MRSLEYRKGRMLDNVSNTAYFLGLSGVILAFLFCLFLGSLIIFLDKELLGFIFIDILGEIFDNSGILYSYAIILMYFYLLLLLVGASLGLAGTIILKRSLTPISGVFMIVGGTISLLCFIIPGILLIVSGIMVFYSSFKNPSYSIESQRQD